MTKTNIAVNDEVVIAVINKRKQKLGTLRQVAEELKIRPQYMSDIVNGQRRLTTLIASKMGFELRWVRVR